MRLFLYVILSSVCNGSLTTFPWMNTSDTPEDRAATLLAAMNITDKITLLHMISSPLYTGQTNPVPHLGIPALLMNDGRQGFRSNDNNRGATAWPCQLAVASTWDKDLMHSFGVAMGEEFYGKGANVVLAPMLILARVPQGGRNFESVGEDGELAYVFAKAQITGIQSVGGVIANADDFVLNNQETGRTDVSSVCDERTRWELYYRAYEGAVEADVGSFMCSYNRVNGTYACENNQTLGDLKSPSGLNFSGWVLSDWDATHSTVASALAGLDQEMGYYIYFYTSALQKAVESGEVPLARFNDMVTRILVPMFRFGVFDTPPPNATRNQDSNVTSPAHNALARSIAAAGTVLLSNKENLLPLSSSAPLKILVLGDDGHVSPQCCGMDGGSGDVLPPYVVTPFQGVATRAPTGSTVTYLPSSLGVQPLTQYFSSSRKLHYLAYNCYGCPPHGVYSPLRVEGYSFQEPCPTTLLCTTLVILYNAESGANAVVPSDYPVPAGFTPWGNPAAWILPLNYSGAAPTAVLELWVSPGGDYWSLATEASRSEAVSGGFSKVAELGRLMTSQTDPGNPDPTASAAAAADVVVLCVGLHSDEGSDRDPSLQLSPGDAAMVTHITALQPKTVVVLNAPGAVVMPWAPSAGAILSAWFSGQEMGNALADILWGDVNPSGRLALTFPIFSNDTALQTPQQWPGVGGTALYSERLEMGYRWFDAQGVAPRFPFGHGLSYTTFSYSNLTLLGNNNNNNNSSNSTLVTVSFTVTNTGQRCGKEVAQLYLGFPPSAMEPPLLLRDFSVVGPLCAGESSLVHYFISQRDCSTWDVGTHGWVQAMGAFKVYVGASSRDVRLQGNFTL